MQGFFRSRSAPAPLQTPDQGFPYPLPNCPPIAVFWPDATPEEAEISQLDVKTVAAPMRMLRAIGAESWSLEYPAVALSDIRDGLISQHDRDYIWSRFGVPLFEYLVDGRDILARECEAHEGLHFDNLPEAWKATTTDEPCACGRPGPRLLRLDVIIEKTGPVRMWRNWQTRQI